MVTVNVEHQFILWWNTLALSNAHNAGPHGEAIIQFHLFVLQVLVFMAKNGLIDSDF